MFFHYSSIKLLKMQISLLFSCFCPPSKLVVSDVWSLGVQGDSSILWELLSNSHPSKCRCWSTFHGLFHIFFCHSWRLKGTMHCLASVSSSFCWSWFVNQLLSVCFTLVWVMGFPSIISNLFGVVLSLAKSLDAFIVATL